MEIIYINIIFCIYCLLQFSVSSENPFVDLIIEKDSFFNTKIGSYIQNFFHIDDVNIL